MTWSKQLAQQLRSELSPEACTVIDVLATRPGHRFTTAELVAELSLTTEHSLRAFLGTTTKAARRIGVAQDEPHSWFVLWEKQPEWRYWLDEERAGWWIIGGVWSTEELKAAVDSYLQMLDKHRTGQTFVKKAYYRELSKRFGRTEKSFEYRAQNISFVLELMGRDWIPGLVPAKNVGPRVAAELEQLIAEAEGKENSRKARFEAEVRSFQRKKNLQKPQGRQNPKSRSGKSTLYDRDPAVVAWVLNLASGICESCGCEAPFLTGDDKPFLEVHHVRKLADNGSDTVENAVAVCPNCHRALHHAVNRLARTQSLYEKVDRLIQE